MSLSVSVSYQVFFFWVWTVGQLDRTCNLKMSALALGTCSGQFSHNKKSSN